MTGLVLKDDVVALSSPKALAEFATTLKTFIVENELYTPIQDKNYVNVEGWQFAGASLGVFPIVTESVDLSSGTEIKYKAVVELVRVSDGVKVGSGEAICSNKESKRKSADEYVILSMAQTRATGKAFRMMLSWIMKLAGYETTPSEEVQEDTTPSVTAAEIPIDDIKSLVDLKLSLMGAAEKVKFTKDIAKTVSNKLSDEQYRNLYAALLERKRAEEEAKS